MESIRPLNTQLRTQMPSFQNMLEVRTLRKDLIKKKKKKKKKKKNIQRSLASLDPNPDSKKLEPTFNRLC